MFLPLLLLTCLLALLLNAAIMAAILCSAHLLRFQSSGGYLPTVTSLVCSDTLTSLMLGRVVGIQPVLYQRNTVHLN